MVGLSNFGLNQVISSLKTVEKVELNPYHELGKFKWENLGFEYPLKNIKPATDKDIKRAKEILGLETKKDPIN